MAFVRVDNRLVHGQIIETWLPFTRARSIVVVNDELASDFLRQEIMSLAIPAGVHIEFVQVAGLVPYLAKTPWNPTTPWSFFPIATTRNGRTRAASAFPCSILGICTMRRAKSRFVPMWPCPRRMNPAWFFFGTRACDSITVVCRAIPPSCGPSEAGRGDAGRLFGALFVNAN